MESKPDKPYPEYPLFSHPSGQWAKKIKGQTRYFGVWADPKAALNKYLSEVDHWQAGKTPPGKCVTIADILDSFLGGKEQDRQAGEISDSTFDEYQAICDTIADTLGKTSSVELLTVDDLVKLRAAIGKGLKRQLSPVTQKKRLTYVRMVLSHANEELGQLIRFKKTLRAPKAATIRKHRNKVGEQLFSADEIRKLVNAAGPQMKAMILLGINCGFGNSDCASLPIERLDLANGWHTYWRPKTQVARRCPLWQETVSALRTVVENRKSGLVFITKFGNPWTGQGRANPIAFEFRKLADSTNTYRARATTFYSLRRTFETIASTADVNQAVIDHIMGHTREDMATVYRQKVFDAQLKKCVAHVRKWYLGAISLE